MFCHFVAFIFAALATILYSPLCTGGKREAIYARATFTSVPCVCVAEPQEVDSIIV